MAKHAMQKSKTRQIVATASVFTVSMGSIVALAPASSAISCPANDPTIGMTSSTVLNNTVCELVFLPTSSSPSQVTWTPPAGVGKVSALIIGGGSAAYEGTDFNIIETYAAGGAGEVTYVDDLGTGALGITVGLGQLASDATGSGVITPLTIWPGGGETAVVGAQNYIASGGGVVTSLDNTSGDDYAWAGDSGNEFLGGRATNGQKASGAGASANGSIGHGDVAGGAGITVAGLLADTSLWPHTETTQYGIGGSWFSNSNDLILTQAVQGLGHGGSITWGGTAGQQAGANGSVRIRFSLSGSAPVSPPVASVPYEGPIGLRMDSGNTCVGDRASIAGSRLGSIDKIYIDIAEIPFTLVSDSRITFNVPDLKAGKYQVKYWVPVNSVNLTDSISIGACSQTTPVPETTEPSAPEVSDPKESKPFYVSKRFTNYRGDRGAVVEADRRAITAFINANPGLTHVTCLGSTSGVPALETDAALALARATNACSVVESLVPGVKTRLVTTTGQGVGQFYRAVTLFGKGTKAN
jgi:hypothetical protein